MPPQFAECAAIGGRTQQARPAAGSRCSSGAGGHGARAPAGAGERPGATGRGRRERPSGNARSAAARRTGWGGVPGRPVPPAGPSEPGRGGRAGGAGRGGNAAACTARAALRLRECPTEGAPAAGLRGPFGERRAGFGGGRTYQRPTRLPVGGAAAARPEGPVPHERQAWPASAAMVTRCFRGCCRF